MPYLSRIWLTKFVSGFILAFHDIPPEGFTDFVESVAPLQPVPLENIVARSKAGKSTTGLFAITVDDCVAENTRALVKVLQAKAWPATFYVPTAYVDSDDRIAFQWWFKLVPFLSGRVLHLKSEMIDFSSPGSVAQQTKKMEALWHTRRLQSYLPTILEMRDVLMRDYDMRIDRMMPPAVLGWSEITQFSKNDLCRFESHGVSHSALSALTAPEIELELTQSKNLISEHTGRECRHFAYPFGNSRSIGSLPPSIMARHYDSAVTMTLGGVDGANLFLLPRIPLYPENSRRFAHSKILLKCTSLNLIGRNSSTRRHAS